MEGLFRSAEEESKPCCHAARNEIWDKRENSFSLRIDGGIVQSTDVRLMGLCCLASVKTGVFATGVAIERRQPPETRVV